MTSATGLFQLLLSPLLSRSAMAFFLLLFFLCTVVFFKSWAALPCTWSAACWPWSA